MIDFDLIAWDPEENVQHVAEHGLTPEEVDSVLENPLREGASQTTGRPVVWGWTYTGRHIMVVFEVDDAGGYVVICPVTAYEVPPTS